MIGRSSSLSLTVFLSLSLFSCCFFSLLCTFNHTLSISHSFVFFPIFSLFSFFSLCLSQSPQQCCSHALKVAWNWSRRYPLTTRAHPHMLPHHQFIGRDLEKSYTKLAKFPMGCSKSLLNERSKSKNHPLWQLVSAKERRWIFHFIFYSLFLSETHFDERKKWRKNNEFHFQTFRHQPQIQELVTFSSFDHCVNFYYCHAQWYGRCTVAFSVLPNSTYRSMYHLFCIIHSVLTEAISTRISPLYP